MSYKSIPVPPPDYQGTLADWTALEPSIQYSISNRVKIAASNKLWRQQNYTKIEAKKKLWRQKNKEKFAASKKLWKQQNAAKVANIARRVNDTPFRRKDCRVLFRPQVDGFVAWLTSSPL